MAHREVVSNRPVVVLDTCVLLADPASLESFPGCDVVVPLTVVEELDGHKSRFDDIGQAARMVARRLEDLRASSAGSLADPVPLPGGSTLRIEVNGLLASRVAAAGLSASRAENRILAAALGLAEGGAPVRLVSVDATMRLKASALGLVAQDWGRPGSLPAGPGWREVDAGSALVEAAFHDGELPLVAEWEVLENEFVVLRCGSQSALLRRCGDRLLRVKESPRAWGLAPRSKEQMFALNLLLDPAVQIVSLEGSAGTGKTVLALAAALEQVFEPASRAYDRLVILRPVVAVGRQDLGFLPGDVEAKLGPWFEAITDAIVALGDGVSYAHARRLIDGWVEQGSLALDAVTFLRGRSLQRTLCLVDEAQNLEAPLTLKTILTRMGEGSKAVLLGDVSQVDAPYTSPDTNALTMLRARFTGSALYGHVTLTRGERSAVASLAARLL